MCLVRQKKTLGLLGAFALCAASGFGATIQGTVKGPDGAPIAAAFVQAQNSQTKIWMMAPTDAQGKYRVDKLPAGTYQVVVRAVGFKTDPKTGVALTADQSLPLDIALQAAPVRWQDVSVAQAKHLIPESDGKKIFFDRCNVCHSFQTRLAAVSRDQDGYKDRLTYMRTAMNFSFTFSGGAVARVGDRFTDADMEPLSKWLADSFGVGATLPRPEAMPGYKDTIVTFGPEAAHIVYVEYDMPGSSRMPFSAAPAKDGSVWIPNFGTNNKITRLDPKTGKMEDFVAPTEGTAAIHSAVPAPDGSVWTCQQGSNEIGKWDPATRKIVEFQDPYVPGKERTEAGGEKHTCRIDPGGNIWATGAPLTRFDPKTREFTHFFDLPLQAYGIEMDATGNVWFTKQSTNEIGMADWKTLKVTYWKVPNSKKMDHPYPRRLNIDSKGIVWVAEYSAGTIDRFDPALGKFTNEYPLPGAGSTPYGLGVDANDTIWYSSFEQDVLGAMDPKTGKVTLYPFPHVENTIREFFRDPQGNMWYGTPSNNRVGYWYLAK